jgi:Meiotically up-regulated gene 113
MEIGMRDLILSEIKRIAVENGGVPPGVMAFERATAITQGKWCGVFWPRWSSALEEAGFKNNTFTQKIDSFAVLQRLAILIRGEGKLPAQGEYRLLQKSDKSLPTDSTLRNHFGVRKSLVDAVITFARDNSEYSDILSLLPKQVTKEDSIDTNSIKFARQDGYVYFIKSGAHFKIGKSGDLERRVKEIRTALPEKADLFHTIRTDDPSGIEAYWHRRFAAKRANGEWFNLSPADIAAFKRRKFM